MCTYYEREEVAQALDHVLIIAVAKRVPSLLRKLRRINSTWGDNSQSACGSQVMNPTFRYHSIKMGHLADVLSLQESGTPYQVHSMLMNYAHAHSKDIVRDL